jgi:hypothetical protein
MVIEREISALNDYERRLDRQLEKWPTDSDDWRGAHQAKDEVRGRIMALRAGIAMLQNKPVKGLRP